MNMVKIYDSLYTTISKATMHVIDNLFNNPSAFELVQVQKQQNGQDCGLFAIGIATAILFEIDVTRMQLCTKEMRNHLHTFQCSVNFIISNKQLLIISLKLLLKLFI